jgi:hypothetical protein
LFQLLFQFFISPEIFTDFRKKLPVVPPVAEMIQLMACHIDPPQINRTSLFEAGNDFTQDNNTALIYSVIASGRFLR